MRAFILYIWRMIRETATTAALLAIGAVYVGCDNPSNGGGNGDPGTFKTATAGGQTWMAENLNIKTGNSWCYYNKTDNCKKYGRLYDWKTAMTACPEGWRLPSINDWNNLITATGGPSAAGKNLKSKSGWSNNGNGRDTLGFSALPGGHRHTENFFNNATYDGYWWSATESGSRDYAYYKYMDYGVNSVYEDYIDKGNGFSVRCVKKDN